jgi:hypothetical protein
VVLFGALYKRRSEEGLFAPGTPGVAAGFSLKTGCHPQMSRNSLDTHVDQTQKHVARSRRLLEATSRKVAEAADHVTQSQQKLATSTERLKRQSLSSSILPGLRQDRIQKKQPRRSGN